MEPLLEDFNFAFCPFFFAYSVITYIKFMKRLQMCQREELLGPTQLKYNIVQIC